MYVKRAKLTSYSSFADSDWIDFTPSINVIIGENNSGKSALLSALRPPLENKQHKNSNTYLPGSVTNSRVDVDIICDKHDFLERVAATNRQFNMPVVGEPPRTREAAIEFWQDNSNITLACTRSPNSTLSAREGRSLDWSRGNVKQSVALGLSSGEITFRGYIDGISDNIPEVFDDTTAPSFYYFSAQRLNVGSSPFADERLLSPSASNLPNVLAYLQGSRRLVFDEIQDRAREIIPSVDAISVTPSAQQQHVLVRSDRFNGLEELAFKLNECGTGVAQTIAILTAVISSRQSVIIIDEISSFLHPAAVKRLINLFRTNYDYHQYILSTHSTDVISASDPPYVHLVERSGYESKVRRIETANIKELRHAAQLLGISMLDVFGYEHVVWVEGPTEELCFRRIVSHFGKPLSPTVAISKVPATGDFSRKATTKKALLKIYKTTAELLAPLTRGMAFALDREKLSDDESEKVSKETDGELRLLPRRCIENYLLDPAAITSVINNEFRSSVSHQAVQDAFQLIGRSQELSPGKLVFGSAEWLKRGDGAMLLHRLFGHLTQGRLEYSKTRHGQLILDEILRTNDNLLRELFEFVDERISKALHG